MLPIWSIEFWMHLYDTFSKVEKLAEKLVPFLHALASRIAYRLCQHSLVLLYELGH